MARENSFAYDQIIENLHDGLYFTDTNRVITYWNRAAERMSGFSSEEVIGRPCSDNILAHIDKDGNHLCTGMCPLAETIRDGLPREAEVYMHHKDGHRVPVSVRVTQMTDNAGEVIGGVELFTDMSTQEANLLRLQELEKMAMLDSLTQLANRNFLNGELKARHQDFSNIGVPYGVLFMDIDNFKTFNDTHGHAMGDAVLKFVAKTLTTNSRPFDVYGRWGGEEFLGIIRNVQQDELKTWGERMVHTIGSSYLQQGTERLQVTISIGGAIVRAEESTDDLLKRADALLYQSKQNGRNQLTME